MDERDSQVKHTRIYIYIEHTAANMSELTNKKLYTK